MLPGKSISENSHSENGAESMESHGTCNGMLDNRENKVSPSVRNITP
jgi:hypothetical protein